MILMIDNYDSFTYNLVQYLGELGKELQVFRNDQISIDEIKELDPEKIVISPGPGNPKQAGISCEVIKTFAGKIPLLGVCLGHQCIAQVLGGEVVRAQKIMHGKTSEIFHDGQTIFKDIPSPFTATRYHSLIVKRETLPKVLEISAWTEDNEIMGLRHKAEVNFAPLEGVQFHPESILTGEGKKLLANFIAL